MPPPTFYDPRLPRQRRAARQRRTARQNQPSLPRPRTPYGKTRADEEDRHKGPRTRVLDTPAGWDYH